MIQQHLLLDIILTASFTPDIAMLWEREKETLPWILCGDIDQQHRFE